MIALTVRQPYADRIVYGAKTIENRIWPTGIRGRLIIHAGKANHERFKRDATVSRLPHGALVGTVQLVGCHEASENCCHGVGREFVSDEQTWHFVLDDPRVFVTPIPARGYQKFWTPTESEQYLVGMAIEELGGKR